VQIRVRRPIDAPAETAWRIVADVERWPEWTPTVTSVERRSEGPIGVGARFRIRQPKLAAATWTITEWIAGQAFTWVARSPGFRIVADHEIRAEPRGSSVELRVRFEGLLGGIAGRLYAGITERYMNLEADGLRSRSESAVANR